MTSQSTAILLIAIGLSTAAIAPAQRKGSVANSSFESGRWKTLQKNGEDLLRRASRCSLLELSNETCPKTELLISARALFLEMAKVAEAHPDPVRALVVANDLMKCGATDQAVSFLEKMLPLRNGSLVHLLGDALFSIGDFEHAAEAYREWIKDGCNGYIMQPDETHLWAVRESVSRCSTLPIALRAKLDYIESQLPEDVPELGLPEVNYPAIMSTAQ
jgi:hypothetical protein